MLTCFWVVYKNAGVFKTKLYFCIAYWNPQNLRKSRPTAFVTPPKQPPQTLSQIIKLHQNTEHFVHLDTLSLHLSLLSPVFPCFWPQSRLSPPPTASLSFSRIEGLRGIRRMILCALPLNVQIQFELRTRQDWAKMGRTTASNNGRDLARAKLASVLCYCVWV